MMKPSDRVKKSPMWKYDEAHGTIIKITKDYTVVSWDGMAGEWHYTSAQAETLVIIQDKSNEGG